MPIETYLSRRGFLAGVGVSLSSVFIGTGSALLSKDPLPETVPTVIGHRGAAGLAPPNTRAAIEKAIEYDADGVELDVRQTHDGELVLFHDPLLNLSTDGHGIVHETSSEQVLKARIHGEPMLTLAEGLELVQDLNLSLYLELKRPGYAAEVLSAVDEHSLSQQPTIVSFETEPLQTALESDVDVDVGLIGKTPNPSLIDDAEDLGVDSVMAHYVPGAMPMFIEEAKEAGFTTGIWSLIDTEHSIRDALESNPDILTTNRPDIVLRMFGEVK